MEKTATQVALASLERWHADEMNRIGERARKLRGMILAVGAVTLVSLAAAWLF